MRREMQRSEGWQRGRMHRTANADGADRCREGSNPSPSSANEKISSATRGLTAFFDKFRWSHRRHSSAGRASGCQPEGHGCDSHWRRIYVDLAQLVERGSEEPRILVRLRESTVICDLRFAICECVCGLP